jgi:hypothetical protein
VKSAERINSSNWRAVAAIARTAAAFAIVIVLAAHPRVVAATASAPVSATQLAGQDREFENPGSLPGKNVLSPDDEKFLDDLQRRGIQFFIDEADPVTGLMPDRAKANGGDAKVSSIAAIGFGLTALCIGEQRGWVSHDDAYARCLKVLNFLRDHGPGEHGHFYHFLDMRTGQRVWNCEVSNIDTALLMTGVLTVRQHFAGTELASVANELYERVDWPWLLSPDGKLKMGWKPDGGFLEAEWGGFSEGMMIYLLGLGSRTHPLPARSWHAWKREPVTTYAGLTFIQCPPLFTHQYPHCWYDLRGQRDDHADYFRNSQLATIAQRQWCVDELSKRYKSYTPDIWGISASDGPHGYQAWGGPPPQGDIDGSVVPCAAAGSLVFEPRLCIQTLRAMKDQFGAKAYLKYGFVDAFNPTNGWYNADVLGIDVGPAVLMAENCRTGFVWRTFMSSPEARAGLKAAGFRPLDAKDTAALATTSIFDGQHK